MKFLTIPLLKKHLNLDKSFTEDDEYIQMLGDVAEQMVATHLNEKTLDDIVTNNGGKLPAPVRHAMLLLVGSMYMNREVVTYGAANDLPHGYDYLLNMYENFTNFQG